MTENLYLVYILKQILISHKQFDSLSIPCHFSFNYILVIVPDIPLYMQTNGKYVTFRWQMIKISITKVVLRAMHVKEDIRSHNLDDMVNLYVKGQIYRANQELRGMLIWKTFITISLRIKLIQTSTITVVGCFLFH